MSPLDKLTELDVNRATLYSGGEALLSPVLGDPAWIKLKNPYPFESGALYVGVAISAISGSPSCNLIADSSSTVATSYPLTIGVQQVAVSGVYPGDTVDRLEVRCAGGSSTSARLDWLTSQNGPYQWAPMRDLTMTASTMAFPSTGRQSVLRVSEDYDGDVGLILAGSDVGGFAWTYPHDPDDEDGTSAYDPTVWYTADGTVFDLQDAADYAVWEVYAEPGTSTFGYDVLMLTGSETYGGLWRSTDLSADDWTLVDGGLSAFKHRDDCPATGKEISSGRLIVEYPSYPAWTVIASGDDANRGIFFWQTGATADEKYTGLPEDGYYEALPSALATHLVADDGAPNEPKEVLLVGYRPIVTTAAGFDANALYLCPADFDPASATGACVPVVDTLDGDIVQDVRDIEVSPSQLFQYDATLNARNRVAFDPTSSIAGTMRAFVNSRDPDCGLYEVTFTKATAASADWTKLLPSAGTSACTLAAAKLEGSTVSPDGEWVLAWGSDGNGDTTYDGGVCAIDLATGTGTAAVPGSVAKNEIWTLIAHPHVEDTWYYGLLQSKVDCTNCTTPGVYALQRRFRADTSTWIWESTRLSGDDLEHRTVVDLDLGPGTASVAPAVRHLYVTTAGGGFWDGSISW